MKQSNLSKIWSLTLVLVISLCNPFTSTFGQAPLPTFSGGVLTKFPVSNQLYPRDLVTNKGTVEFAGSLADPSVYSGVRVKVFRDINNNGTYASGELATTLDGVLGPVVNGFRSFSFNPYLLNAELVNHQFLLVGVRPSTVEDVLVTVNDVVAGDAYILHGQSNAESTNWESPTTPVNSEPNRKFVRVYGNSTEQDYETTMPKNWYVGDGTIGNRAFIDAQNETYPNDNNVGNTGQVGMRIATRIASEYGIPVCVFNGAFGNPISYFQKNFAGWGGHWSPGPGGAFDNNYNRLLWRTTETGMKDKIRAILWWQGESNIGLPPSAIITSRSDYYNELNNIYTNWKADYSGIQKIYLFQIRLGCFNQSGDQTPGDGGFNDDEYGAAVMDAQLGFANDHNDVELISTAGIDQHDQWNGGGFFCHYKYNQGYKPISDRAYNLIRTHFYGAPASDLNITPVPYKADVDFSGPNRLILRMSPVNLSYTVNGVLNNDFRLEGAGSYTINTVTVLGSDIKIAYSLNPGTITPPTGITYFGHSGLAGASITNGAGLALASFQSFPIIANSLPADPLSLTGSRNGGSNVLRWTVEGNDDFESFIVERGATRNTFSEIKTEMANGEPGKKSYSLTDNKPLTQLNHYRIRAIRNDGKEVFSQVVTINSKLNSITELRVYPNPVAQSANAMVTLKENSLATVEIHDASGRLLSARKLQLQKGNNQFSIGEILDYKPGTFIVRVITATETQQVRVVKLN